MSHWNSDIIPSGNDGTAYNGSWKFPNPFFDIASEYVPNDINQILEWCEYLYLTMGTYRSASRRVVRYFLTEIVLEGESDAERQDFESFLDDDLHILSELAQIGDDFMTYGNVFVSLFFPFERFLICPKCHITYHIETLPYKFKSDSLQFIATCKKCQYEGPFNHEDRRSPNRKGVRLIRWNPKQIRLRVHPVSGEIEYYWEIPGDFIKKLRDGKPFYLNSTPWSIIKCLKKKKVAGLNSDNHLFKFNSDSIYHMRETSLAGIPIIGWGIPPIIPNFKLAYYIQVLRRFDEAIALDYIVPHRILYPQSAPGAGAGDPLSLQSMRQFVGHMQSMVKQHRNDPTAVQVAPYPIGYELLGGEGKQLTPKEQIAMAVDELLNALGYPAELYKGSLQIQVLPVALRLFEKSWGVLVDGFNDLINWVTDRIARHFLWGDMSGKLRSVTLADDLERKALSLQAAAGMDISKTTAYRPFGIDYMEEQDRVVEEQQAVAKLQQQAMAESQAQQGLEGGAEGGGEGGGGADMSMGATPGDVHQQAQQLAQQLLLQTPESLRRGELIKIKHSNPTLHALVLQEMDNMRQEMGRQGQAMVHQQAKQEMMEQGGGMVAQASAADMPSSFSIGALIADQVLEYTNADLKKVAMDIKRGVPRAKDAFHFIYARARGWA
jgi:hypothetical protein